MNKESADKWFQRATELEAENKVLRTALTKIASFDDLRAEIELTDRGTYCLFDEPVSVQIAREALDRTKI